MLCILQLDKISGKQHYNTPKRRSDAALKPKLQLHCLERFVGAHVCSDGRWDVEVVEQLLQRCWRRAGAVGDGHSQTQLSCISEAEAG